MLGFVFPILEMLYGTLHISKAYNKRVIKAHKGSISRTVYTYDMIHHHVKCCVLLF